MLGAIGGFTGSLWSAGVTTLAAILFAGAVQSSPAAVRWRRVVTDVDGTTEVAALVVLAAGVLAGIGSIRLASGIIALATLLLVEKSRLHSLVNRIDDVGLRSGVRFAVMALVVTPQEAVQPDRSRGWSRMLETVSGDRTQWEMRTALKFWKGASPAVDGIYLDYDLDSPRMNDDKLVEVDSGYIWITPKVAADPTPGVRVRTSKAVRIRGLSATATAALGCILGWGDAASQMLKEPKKAIADLTPFPPPSEEPDQKGPAPGNDTATPAANDLLADAEILAAAEEVELPAGWRGTLIENISKEFVEIIKVSAPLSTELIDRWLDGMSDDDVREFGTTAGSVLTDRAVAMFTAAANAVQPRPDEAQTTGGQNP